MAQRAIDYASYVEHARRQEEARRKEAEPARRRAWEVAREIADFLRREYRPRRLVVFGSLVHPEVFGPRSDIDIAVDGIPWPAYLRAWNDIERRFTDFKVDLIDIGTVSPLMRKRIEEEGTVL